MFGCGECVRCSETRTSLQPAHPPRVSWLRWVFLAYVRSRTCGLLLAKWWPFVSWHCCLQCGLCKVAVWSASGGGRNTAEGVWGFVWAGTAATHITSMHTWLLLARAQATVSPGGRESQLSSAPQGGAEAGSVRKRPSWPQGLCIFKYMHPSDLCSPLCALEHVLRTV